MTLRDRFHESLMRACLCSQNDPDAFGLCAVLCDDGLTRVWWLDARTGHGRLIGRPLTRREAEEVLPGLFTQLRAWRAAMRPPELEQSMAAAGGAR